MTGKKQSDLKGQHSCILLYFVYILADPAKLLVMRLSQQLRYSLASFNYFKEEDLQWQICILHIL